jgi:CO/xanthine dehydrogenase Mo-binding subunit
MDQVARRLKMDPVEFRLQNLVHPYDMDPVLNLSVGDARVIECLEKGAEAFHWKERFSGCKTDEGRYRRGVGVACGAHKNGMYGGFVDCTSMVLKMNEDGSLNLNASLHDVGCGTTTAMKIIVAEVLDIDPDLITVTEADTELTGYDPGCYGSRVTYNVGACAKETAEILKDKILGCVSFILQKPKEYLKVQNGHVVTIGTDQRGISYKEIAEKAVQENYTDLSVAHTYYSPSNPGSYSVQFAEVIVDTATGLTRVTDFLAVGDVGRVLNRGMVEGQFQGAVQMGIGYALCEEVKIDDQGKPVNNSFKKYHMVNAPDMPDVKVLLIEHEGDDGPFGAKSVGEISAVPTAAAVINAVNHALGTSLSEMPLTPEKILDAPGTGATKLGRDT